MPTNIAGRITTIVAVLVVALWALFPTAPKALLKPFRPDVKYSFKPDLRPGIDMVGGSSLIYDIQGDARNNPDLAEKVATALKKRVDPEGVRNLIWRPQGATRLEIQMPLTDESRAAMPLRTAYNNATQKLEDTNITPTQVRSALRLDDAAARDERLNALAMGSPRRQELFGRLKEIQQRLQNATDAKDAAGVADAETELDETLKQVQDTNLNVSEMQLKLEIADPKQRQAAIDEYRNSFSEFPARVQAIDAVATAYEPWSKVKDQIDDIASLKELLKGSGVLSFHLVATDIEPSVRQQWVDRLRNEGPRSKSGDDLRWMEVERPDEIGFRTEPYGDKEYLLVYITPERSLMNRSGSPKWALKEARPLRGRSGERVVGFEFDPVGASLFATLTSNFNATRPGGPWYLAPALDGRIMTAPQINGPITSGSGEITGGRGGFEANYFDYLIRTLNAGSLPAQLDAEPIVERTVGPQLGEDNLRAGLYSCYFGVIVVAVFLIGYYYLSGVIAMVAVLINLLLILAGMAAFDATFTLPGVAGIILTIGMAVDANVLIFERLREEQVRGMSLRMALRNAYDRAASAIWDSNITTAITAAILYVIGTEEVKGFGLTLLLGLVSSLFTALYVTRTIFAIMIDRFGVEKLGSFPLSVPAWDRVMNPNVNWMKAAPYCMAISLTFIVIGNGLFFWKFEQGKVMDIEFAGGTAVQFQLKEPLNISEVRKIVDRAEEETSSLPAPAVQSVGDDDRTYEVVTVNEDASAVRQAVTQAFAGKLDVAEAVRFDGVDRTFTEANGSDVIPIENESQKFDGESPPDLARHVGGVAIVLRNVTPEIDPTQMRQRIEQQQMPGSAVSRRIDVDKLSTGTYVVLSSDPEVSYDTPGTQAYLGWSDQLAEPLWSRLTTALAKPAELERVTNMNQQVAGQAQIDATLALILSVLAIMIYVWLRFGDLKYGTATVIALAHDTLFVIAAVGFAHVLSDTPIAGLLGLEAFRVNLTFVAAILTVIGFSMNDTVVVFDRIRENRGKYGVVDRQVINDSINQTLSRTLLTGGTTIITILVMYLFGGAGIHGFTYALLIGIVVGTYSSIAIASPILLLGLRALGQRTPEPVAA